MVTIDSPGGLPISPLTKRATDPATTSTVSAHAYICTEELIIKAAPANSSILSVLHYLHPQYYQSISQYVGPQGHVWHKGFITPWHEGLNNEMINLNIFNNP